MIVQPLGQSSFTTKVEASTTNGNIKIDGVETTVYEHPSGTNPHGTTKSDVGLGNVPNVTTNDQTPSYTESSSLKKLTSGEKLSVAFGKISKAITDLISHIGDTVKHITSTERTNWNAAKSHADSAHAPSNAQANVIETIKVNGTALTPSSKAVDITVPTVGNGTITVTQNGSTKGTFTTNQSGNTTIALDDNNTTYSAATTSVAGLMSAEDKVKLDEADNTYASKALYNDTTINVGRKADTTVGSYSTAEGYQTTASGGFSHAEGHMTTASNGACHAEGDRTTASGNFGSHAEGYSTTASADFSHAEGRETTASNNQSHAEGGYTTASGDFGSHAEGHKTTASGDASHAEGGDTKAEGSYSHAEGYSTTASGPFGSHAEGDRTTASAYFSHAEGHSTTADNDSSHAGGHFNAAMITGGAQNNTVGTAFVIGNGTSSTALSNAFSVQFSGVVKAKSTITASTTADYAEFFEWLDGNPDNDDRIGYFVTLDGDKIRIATAADDYILGIVSGEPFVLGNGDCDTWNGMFLRDEFRRTIYEPAPKMVEVDGEFVEVEGEFEGTRPKLNPEYDHTQKYISRFERKEWAPIGMLGVLAVRHDGTAVVNGYVTVNADGIATACEKGAKNAYRVIKSNTDSVVEIIFR